MNIYIGGKWLDVPPQQDITIHGSSMRFTDVLCDAYSTDFELPRTDNNIKLLEAWGEQDRGQMYGTLLPCQIVLPDLTASGMLQVTASNEDTIAATLYFTGLPTALKGQVRDVVQDDATTIIDWVTWSREGDVPTADVNMTLYDNGTGQYAYGIHPNITVPALLSRITTATGVSLPSISADYRLVATKQVVCPQNTTQALLENCDTTASWLQYGQHITNEVTDDITVKFNRKAKVKFSCWLNTTYDAGATVQMRVKVGGLWGVIHTFTPDPTPGNTVHETFTVIIDEGQEWELHYTRWIGLAMIVCDITGYNITADDYDTPLIYNWSGYYSWPAWCGDSGSFIYFGVIANLPDMTCNELLSSLAWKFDKKLLITGQQVTLTNADEAAKIGAQVQSTEFSTDILGQVNKIEDAVGVVMHSFNISNQWLEAEKVLHKSIFRVLKKGGAYKWATINTYELDNNNEYQPADYEGVALAQKINTPSVHLEPENAMGTLGLEDIQKVCLIEAETTDRIDGLDYVYIAGHKFIVVEYDHEIETGFTTFKALEI